MVGPEFKGRQTPASARRHAGAYAIDDSNKQGWNSTRLHTRPEPANIFLCKRRTYLLVTIEDWITQRHRSTFSQEKYEDAIKVMDAYHLERETLETLSDFDMSGKKPLSQLSAKQKRAFSKM